MEKDIVREEPADLAKELINAQRLRWSESFLRNPNAFGESPSEAAQRAVDLFKKEGKKKLLELGSGTGRDTIYFAKSGFQVCALDFAESALSIITKKAQASNLSQNISVTLHDVRLTLPFADESFDACYSFGLFCAALLTAELQNLSAEVRRVLKPEGLSIYTVRHTGDPRCGTGSHLGGDIWEVGPFVVHFFSREKVALLSSGYNIISIDELEEGELPRKLFMVTLRKSSG